MLHASSGYASRLLYIHLICSQYHVLHTMDEPPLTSFSVTHVSYVSPALKNRVCTPPRRDLSLIQSRMRLTRSHTFVLGWPWSLKFYVLSMEP